MSTLNGLLKLGASATSAHRKRIEVVQHNIANATTPGYRRQRLNLEANVLGGVQISGQQSITSNFLTRQLSYQRGQLGYNQSRAEIGMSIEMAINPMDGTDIASRMDAFFASASKLASNPTGMVERRDLIATAQQLGHSFQRATQILNNARQGAQQEAEGLVDKINTRLKRIADLDKEIHQMKGSGQPIGDLVSTRDQIIAELSEEVGVKVVPSGDDGKTQIFTAEGRALLEGGHPRTLAVQTNADGDLEVLLNGAAMGATDGKLGGLVSAHNEVIGDQLNALDEMAFEFVTTFNNLHENGFALDGTDGHLFFDPIAGVQGAAGLISVNAAIVDDPELIAASDDATQQGNNALLMQLIALQDAPLSSGESPSATLRSLIQKLGNELRVAEDNFESAAISLNQLEGLEASISGVSLEEEMVALMEAQRAFDASAKIIKTTSEMFDTILSLK